MFSLILIVLWLSLVFEGIYGLVNGYFYREKSKAEKHAPDAYRKWVRITSVFLIICAVLNTIWCILDLPSWFYVYLLDFGLFSNLIHHLALYQVSVRRLKSFATPLTPPLALLLTACGSLHLAVTTRDWTFTSKKCVIPDTPNKGLRKI